MKRKPFAGVHTIVPAVPILTVWLDGLTPWTALLLSAGCLVLSLIHRILDWWWRRDRDERFAGKSASVRRDLLELYRLDRSLTDSLRRARSRRRRRTSSRERSRRVASRKTSRGLP